MTVDAMQKLLATMFLLSSAAFSQVPSPDAALSRALAARAGDTGMVEKVLRFDDDQQIQHVAVLGAAHHHLRVLVFRNAGDHLKLEWSSGNLSRAFAVHSPDNLDIVQPRDEPMVVFRACASHECDPGGVWGWLLYSSVNHIAVQVETRGGYEHGQTVVKSRAYSQQASSPKLAPYRKLLDKWIENCVAGEGGEGCANFNGN